MECIKLQGKAPNINIPVSQKTNEQIPMTDPRGDDTDDNDNIADIAQSAGHDNIDFGNMAECQDIQYSPTIETNHLESPEDKLRKRQIINKIRKYKELFAIATQEIDTSNVWDRSLSELENLLENVEFVVAVRQSGKQSRTIFLSGLAVWEQLGKKILKLNLDGFNLCSFTITRANGDCG